MPVGNLAGLLLVLALATFLRVRLTSRLLGVALGAGAGVATSLVVPSFPGALFASPAASLLVGFLPPALIGGGFLLWRRRAKR